MKRRCFAALLVILMLGVTACGEKEAGDTEQKTEETADAAEEKGEQESISQEQVAYSDLVSTVTKLGTYRGIPMNRVVEEVTDEDVEDEVWSVQKLYAELQDVDREAQLRDVTVIDYTGYVDGETSDSLQGEAYALELGSGSFVPGFEDQLIGAKAGEDREVVLTFPEDYYEEMAGKEARFDVHVQKVQEYVLTNWNDEFIKESLDYENEEDLRNSIRAELEKTAEEDADANAEYDLMMQIIGDSEYDLQEADVEAYTDEMIREYQMYAAMMGMDLESYLQQNETTEEDVRKMYRETAEFRVKLILTLHEIAKAEGITVSEEDYQSTLEELSAQYGDGGTEEVEALYGQEMLQDQLIQEKVLDFIRENANN